MANDYAALADVVYSELPDEKLLPDGTWLMAGRNAAYMPPKEESKARLTFFYNAKEPMDDVDEGELAELGDDYDYTENDATYVIFIEGAKTWKKKVYPFLALHGIVPEDENENIKDTLKRFKGAEVYATLGQREYEDRDGQTQKQQTMSHFAKV